jgi:hypothetical protein
MLVFIHQKPTMVKTYVRNVPAYVPILLTPEILRGHFIWKIPVLSEISSGIPPGTDNLPGTACLADAPLEPETAQ